MNVLRDIVYYQPLNNILDLKTKIRGTVATIEQDTLENVIKKLGICICFVGGEGRRYFKHLLN